MKQMVVERQRIVVQHKFKMRAYAYSIGAWELKCQKVSGGRRESWTRPDRERAREREIANFDLLLHLILFNRKNGKNGPGIWEIPATSNATRKSANSDSARTSGKRR